MKCADHELTEAEASVHRVDATSVYDMIESLKDPIYAVVNEVTPSNKTTSDYIMNQNAAYCLAKNIAL